MSYDLKKILASKQKFRHDLASRDITEKLRMLDALHERALLLRRPAFDLTQTHILREESPTYPAKQKKKIGKSRITHTG